MGNRCRWWWGLHKQHLSADIWSNGTCSYTDKTTIDNGNTITLTIPGSRKLVMNGGTLMDPLRSESIPMPPFALWSVAFLWQSLKRVIWGIKSGI